MTENLPLELAAGTVRFAITPLRPGALLVAISGDDQNQLGEAPFMAIERELARHGRLELFIDTRGAMGAALAVQRAWTEWFARNRQRLSRVHLLAPTRFLSVAAGAAKLFSRTGELIQIYADCARFEEAVAVARGTCRP